MSNTFENSSVFYRSNNVYILCRIEYSYLTIDRFFFGIKIVNEFNNILLLLDYINIRDMRMREYRVEKGNWYGNMLLYVSKL